MKNILVSGASGIVGYGILRSLKRSGKELRLIGTTIYDDSIAEAFCDIFEKAPPTDDPKYLNWLLDIINKHDIKLLFPGIEVDMYKWVEHIPAIEKGGAKALLNRAELISLCKDKWLFYESLKGIKSPYRIETTLESDFDALVNTFSLPFLLKPRRGFGSKGIVKVNDRDTFLRHSPGIGPVLMAQEFVGNDNEEYTTSAFCDGNGGFYCSMTLRRKLSKDGFTEKAEVVELDGINEAIRTLCNHYKPEGPTNFQFRVHNGMLKLLEINPRISSATSIRSAFGYNESQMAIEYFLEGKTLCQPVIMSGKAIRYVEDFIHYL
jgi:carbamoyl-phosphate synthase large subunit